MDQNTEQPSTEQPSGELSGTEQPSPAQPAETAPSAESPRSTARPRKGPLSFLSGSLTSFGFAWLALQLSGRVVGYYGEHPPHYDARFAQSIAVFMKTLIVGMTFLATFTFAFVGLGLLLTCIRSLMPGWREAEDGP
ncbi:MAG: hypothetical protein RLZZ611_2023 [Cyanobacteriota bacterium]|jgi:hypothetical protein